MDKFNQRGEESCEPSASLISEKLPAMFTWTAWGSLVFIVLGAKLLLIKCYGSAMPFWDQWGAEANLLYRSYLNSNLSLQILFSSHNEHRILTSRILSLFLFELNGGWNPILQMIANAFIHVTAIVLLFFVISRLIEPSLRSILVTFCALVFALPIGWENTLGGFQGPFYFVELFSFAAILGLVTSRAFTLCWWVGLLCSLLAYFSMASGALTVLAAFAIIGLQLILNIRKGIKEIVAEGILLVLAISMLFGITHVPGHDVLGAHTIIQFLGSFLQFLAYPFGIVGVFFNIPILIYPFVVLRLKPRVDSMHWVMFGLIVWLVTQAASLAYGRAVGINASRYLDIAIVGIPLNLSVLLLALGKQQSSFKIKQGFIFLSLWLMLVIPTLVSKVIRQSFPQAAERNEDSLEQYKNVTQYLAGDSTALQGKARLAIPYPNPDKLAGLLSDPFVQMELPDSIRPANVDKSELLNRTVLKGRTEPFMKELTSSLLKNAGFLLGVGLSLAFIGMLMSCFSINTSSENANTAI